MDGSKRLFLKTETGFSKIRNFCWPDIMGRNASQILIKENSASRLSQQKYDQEIPDSLDSFVEPLNEGTLVALHNMVMQRFSKR